MKKLISLLLAILMVASLAACGTSQSANPAETAENADTAPTETANDDATAEAFAAWKAYVKDAVKANAPSAEDAEAVSKLIDEAATADEVEALAQLKIMFDNTGLMRFVPWGRENGYEVEPMGDHDPSGGPQMPDAPIGSQSGDGPQMPDGPIGEQPGNAAGGAKENTAHGGTPGAVSEDDYKAYLKAWLAAECEVNPGLQKAVVDKFTQMIDEGNYTDTPVDMLFNGMMETGTAMTFEEFVAANGVY